jgi:TonB family protein
LVRRFIRHFRALLSLDRAGLISLGLIAFLLGSWAPGAAAQEDPSQPIVPRMAGIFVKPVAGAPFSATVEFVSRQKLPDGSVFTFKTINHIARDSAGRTHNESRRFVSDSYKQEPPLTEIRIYDPLTSLSTHMDPLASLARQTRMHEPPEPNAKSVPDSNPNQPGSPIKQVEDLGSRTFQNLTLHGTRQTRGTGDFDEFWYSPDFSIYMSRKHQDPVWEQTVSITELKAQEPDPSDFTIPAEYRLVNVEDKRPMPDASGVYQSGNGVVPPTLTYAPEPQYTNEARRAKYSGSAVLELVVDAQGNPQNVRVVRHLQMGLDEKALEAVRQYRFTPATLEGKPVPVWAHIVVNFKIY